MYLSLKTQGDFYSKQNINTFFAEYSEYFLLEFTK
jgi:hypothetical protein